MKRRRAGLQRVKKEGKMLGCLAQTSEVQRKDILGKHQSEATISELARQYGASRFSISRIAKPDVSQA